MLRAHAPFSFLPLARSTPCLFGPPIVDFRSPRGFTRDAASAEMTGAPTESLEAYSVWALPPDSVRNRLKRLMATLRCEFGGPAFEPHITVVGSVRISPDNALSRFRSACAALCPYRARVSAIGHGAGFFRCVFLLIDPTPEVIEASAYCCSQFERETSTPYMPHLSLLYGELTERERERARLRVEALDKEILGLSFEVSALALYKTDTMDKSLKWWEMVEVRRLPSLK